MKRLLIVFAAAVAAASVPGGNANAQTATNNLAVSATVIGSCTIDPATLSFGNYVRTSATATTASAVITVNCTQDSLFWIGLGLGSNASGSTRRMANGSGQFLTYELYRENTSYTDVWNDADPAPAYPHTTAVNPLISPYTQTVYGRIPPNQLVPSGNYSDTVTMTVHF